MGMLRICMISGAPMPPREGIGLHIFYLSRFLRDQGCEITIITRRRADETEVDEFEGIPVYRVTAPFLPPFHLYLHSLFLKPLFAKLAAKMDLFHVHHPLVPVLDFSRPVVTTIHSSLIEDIRHYESRTFRNNVKALVTRTYYRRVIQRYLQRSNAVITVSPTVLSELHQYYRCADTTITVIPNGVDTDFFSPRPADSNQCVLFVGRLGDRKGVEDFLAAGEIIGKRFPSVEFLIVGEGPLRPQLERRAAALSVARQIHFVGWKSRTEIRDLYRTSTVFVFPSRYEAAPLTLLEAMASGLPVVSTRVGFASQVIQHEENGVLVNPASPEEIARAVVPLLRDANMRFRLGANARAKVVNEFTWSKVGKSLLAVYQSTLGGLH